MVAKGQTLNTMFDHGFVVILNDMVAKVKEIHARTRESFAGI